MGFPPASEPCTSHQKQGHEYEDESPHWTNEPRVVEHEETARYQVDSLSPRLCHL